MKINLKKALDFHITNDVYKEKSNEQKQKILSEK